MDGFIQSRLAGDPAVEPTLGDKVIAVVTALLLILLLGSLVTTWVGYVGRHHLDVSGFPVTAPLFRLKGSLPAGATLTVADLERFGYVTELHGPGEFRIRPLSRFEQRDSGGVSAAPYDHWTCARLRVADGAWLLEARTILGPILVFWVLAALVVIASNVSGLSIAWALFGAVCTLMTWRLPRLTYRRLRGQLTRLGA